MITGGLPRLGLDSFLGGAGFGLGRKRKFKYSPDIQAVVLRQFTSQAPKKGLFSGQERRLIVRSGGGTSGGVVPKGIMSKF